MIFYSKNLPQYACKFFLLAYDKALSFENNDNATQMLTNAGVMYEMSGDYVAALKNYQKSLKVFTKTGNKKSQALVYNNIAIIHQELDNVNLAYYNLKKSFDLKKEIGDRILIASAYNNLGVYFEEQKNDPDSALIFYSRAKQIYRKMLFPLPILNSFSYCFLKIWLSIRTYIGELLAINLFLKMGFEKCF